LQSGEGLPIPLRTFDVEVVRKHGRARAHRGLARWCYARAVLASRRMHAQGFPSTFANM
jgi:hypothetical protein